MDRLEIIGIVGVCLILGIIIWFMRHNLKKNPRTTIVGVMATLIFIITAVTAIKTYIDYDRFLDAGYSQVLYHNIVLALFLDLSIFMIGGLFLYLANQIYTSDYIKSERERNKAGEEKKDPHKQV